MIIYLDTETSGLRPGQICQLSYVMQDRENTFAKNFFFTVDSVEYGAYMIHGFSVEKLKSLSKGKRFSDCVDEIKKDFESCDLLVAHNTSFDMMFLRAEFERLNLTLPISNQFCSMKSTTPICKIKGKREGYKYPKLSELLAHYNIQDFEILKDAERLFGCSCGYHDARFDTTAVYLAMDYAMYSQPEISLLKEYL